jgi:hypothetical protein
MRGSKHFVRWTLGPMALLALTAGCGSEQQRPAVPPFESEVSETRAYGPGERAPSTTPPVEPGTTEPGTTAPPAPMGQEPSMTTPGTQPMAPTAPSGTEPPQTGAMTGPESGTGTGTGMGGTGTGTGTGIGTGPGTTGDTTPNETETCDALTRDAKISVEDTRNGVVLVMRPTQAGNLEHVRESARRLETQWPTAGSESRGSAGTETCALFDIGRQGAKVTVNETANAIRLQITTDDSSGVKNLRSQARDFAKKSKATKTKETNP